MKTKLWNRLSIKLIVSISVILIFILALYTYISVTNLEENLTKFSFQNAYNMSDVIKKSTRYSMLLNRREDVHQIIKTIGTETGVKGIRIYNKQGIIIFSTDSTELMKKVDLSAEACIVCHNSAIPHKNITKQSKMRIFTSANNKRVLGLINPIQNEKDCASEDCHAHSPQIQILGVLDVMVSLAELDSIKTANTRATILNSGLITVIIALACGAFIIVLVNIPMRKLSKGIEEVGNGNLNYKININSKNELGQMARRFNDMSGKLNEAYESIKNWSETLTDKVNEKTEELKNIYNQVNQIEKLASLGKLSATVAHELNNPLEGILTFSRLIEKKLRNIQKENEFEQVIEYLRVIADESSRCGKIVKDLLLFSHRGDNEFIKESLTDIIDKSLKIINHHFEINNVCVEKYYSENNIVLNCNPQKIQQALMSLFYNSVEAMPNGGKVEIYVEREHNSAVVRIKDEGTGIAEKDLRHIFEPFYSTKDAANGTGLGLAVVYGIVTNHHGYIEVEKTSLYGTTFKIILPLDLKENRDKNESTRENINC